MVQIVKRASDVRISEINLSQVIIGASSTVGCIPIVSAQGSTSPLFFSSATPYLAEYGNPNPAISMTIQTGLNFFKNGNQLWAVRVPGTGAQYSALLLYKNAFGQTALMSVAVTDPSTVDMSSLVSYGQEAIALFYPSCGPGSYANKYSVSITPEALTVPAPSATNATGGTLSAGSYSYQVSALAVGGEGVASSAVSVTLTASGSVLLSWAPVTGAVGYNIYGNQVGSGYGLLTTVGGATFTFTDNGSLSANTGQQPITVAANAYNSNVFAVNVYNNQTGQQLETWNCTLTPSVSSAGVQQELENAINPFSAYIQVLNNTAALPSVPTVGAVAETAMSGGTSGSAPTSAQIAAAMQVFANSQLYGTNVFMGAGIADPVYGLAMDTLVSGRGDAVSFLDVPSTSQTAQAAVDYRNLTLNLNSSYSALFNPDLLQTDLINGQNVYNPPSGWAGSLCAFTDNVANPAYSIAGLNRGLVPVLKQRYEFEDGDGTLQFDAQVNYFRTFVGQGIALWEQQTLSAEFSALSWISVRRIVNVIKVAMYKYLLYALQEMPTDEVKRQIVNGSTAYLDTVINSGGLSSADVVCDASNNPPAAQNAGVLVVSLVLVPMIPIHEIQLQVIITFALNTSPPE